MIRAAKSLGGVALLAMTLITVLSAPSFAFRPVENLASLNILLPAERDVPVYETVSAAESPFISAAAFEARIGSQWKYWWNEATGTPTQVWGPGYDTGAGFVATAEQAEEIAREFIAEHAGLFGTNGDDLVLYRSSNGLGKWGLVFHQKNQGLLVVGGRVHVVMMQDTGRIYNFGSDYYRGIEISVNPAMSTVEALQAAKSSIGFVEGRDKVLERNEVVIVPDPTGGVVTYHLAYINQVEVEDPFGVWSTTVDANTGDILGRWNEIQFLDYYGHSQADVQIYSYCYGPSPGTRLTSHRVTIGGGVGTVFTDENGDFFVSSGVSGDQSITAGLDGRWINTQNQGGGQAAFVGTISPGSDFTVEFDNTNSQADERDVYWHGNVIHDAVKAIDPALVQADIEMPARVSISATCNAYFQANTINFYRAGGGCANTGELGDVVFHEYAHGITSWVYGGNNCDTGESGSDIWMMLLQELEPTVAEGFYIGNCVSGIRTCQNNFRYPDNYSGGNCHGNGQIMCGFWWDTSQELLLSMSTEEVVDLLLPLFHFSRKNTLPSSFPAQVLAAFVTDDDDGNLDNGTPHHAALCVGAENHGFDCPEILEGVIIQHVPLECTEEENQPFDVEATIYSTLAQMDPDKVDLYYSIDGGLFTVVDMVDQGEDLWIGQIPGQPQPTDISYYISAEDLDGNLRTSPPNAPLSTHDFAVAFEYDPFEVDSGWSVGDAGDDATTGIWERVDPVPTIAQPGDDVTPSGTDCWVTGQHIAGQQDGYNDIDGGKTTLLSPAYDLTGASAAEARWYEWYSNDQGAAPGEDFWVIDARNNGGAWTNITNTNISTNAWVPFAVDIMAVLGEPLGSVEFRFIGSDENQGSLVECAIDEFKLMVDQGSSDAPGAPAGRLAYSLADATPNPFGLRTSIRFSVPEKVRASLKVYSVDGRQVRNLLEKTVEPGSYNIAWDSRDDGGRSVAAGVYYYVLDAGSFRSTRQMVLTK